MSRYVEKQYSVYKSYTFEWREMFTNKSYTNDQNNKMFFFFWGNLLLFIHSTLKRTWNSWNPLRCSDK